MTTKDYLNMQISFYNDRYQTKSSKTITYRELLKNHDEFINTPKESLPVVTIHGVFNEGRTQESAISVNPVVCIDIDYKDNINRLSCDRALSMLQYQLFNNENVIAVAKSASGKGLFALVATENCDPVKYYSVIATEWESRYFLKIDKSCGNVSRIRYVAASPDALIKDDEEEIIPYHIDDTILNNLKGGVESSRTQIDYTQEPELTGKLADRLFLHKALCWLYKNDGLRLDSEHEWFTYGCAFASLGEIGRGYFHLFSKISKNYKGMRDTDRKFAHCLKYSKIGKNSAMLRFYALCKQRIGRNWVHVVDNFELPND